MTNASQLLTDPETFTQTGQLLSSLSSRTGLRSQLRFTATRASDNLPASYFTEKLFIMTVLRNALLLVSVLAALSACGGPQQEPPPPPVRPVKLFTVEGAGGDALRRFPGAINASQRAELSFRVNGVLQEIPVKEGDKVKKGQVLAKLDPTDYQIRVSDRQATFDKTKKNFDRAKELIQDGTISQSDYDQVEANFRTSEAALKLARQELAYTQLKAPFDGSIGRRDVDNFEEIQPKQAIFQLQNVDQLDVAIDLPKTWCAAYGARNRQAASAIPRHPGWSKPMPASKAKRGKNSR